MTTNNTSKENLQNAAVQLATDNLGQAWESHLIPGKLYLELNPDQRSWNEAQGQPMMFLGWTGEKITRWLCGDRVVERLKPKYYWPDQWWERVL